MHQTDRNRKESNGYCGKMRQIKTLNNQSTHIRSEVERLVPNSVIKKAMRESESFNQKAMMLQRLANGQPHKCYQERLK